MHRSAVRTLVWFALGAQVAFVASWVLAGALDDGYSHVRFGVSALAGEFAEHPGIVMVGLALLGGSLVALAIALVAVLPRRPASIVAAALFAAAGAVLVASGPVQLECSMTLEPCRDAFYAGALDGEHTAHLWLSLAATVFLVATPYAISRALWPSPVAAAALAGANIGFWLAVAIWAATSLPDSGAPGLVQRAGLLVLHAWVVIVAAGVLHATRRPPTPGPLIQVRPRDFLAREWVGEGELVLRPLVLGRFFAQRFRARRRATWIDERTWRFDDEATFDGGHVQRRHMWCEFVADDRVRLTAGDLPDGAEVMVEEDGFRIVPFRFAFPLGPLPWLGRCRDRSRVLPDGTFVNELDAYAAALPIPIARLTFRVRPADHAPPGPAATEAQPAGAGAR
jgi:hypothetical protein